MNANEQPWVEVVRRRAAGLRYGTIQITIHDGCVTQVEATEKTRFAVDRQTEAEPSTGEGQGGSQAVPSARA